MISRLAAFIAKRRSEVYEEVRSDMHDQLTTTFGETFASFLPAGGTLLDIGCGHGPALDFFTGKDLRTIGISLCPAEVQECRARGHDTREMDMHAMPGEWTGFFDAVWARHALEHSVCPLFALTEIRRVLKPGGWLYAEMPAPGTVAGHCGNVNHYSVLTIEMWGSLLVRAGFVGADTYTHIPIPLAMGPDAYFSFTVQKPTL